MFITTNNNFADDGTSIKRYYSKPLLNEVVTRYRRLCLPNTLRAQCRSG